MNYQCPRCQERVKDWEGDDPKCGFDENGNFLENNWNCATLNALRERAEENTVWSNNQQNVSVIQTYDVGHAILSWYKWRGQTDDFRDGYFDRGTLTYAQQILGDREPDNGFDGWEDSIFDEDEE
jgi:hypothetical protein